jgi:hypothetical protein
MLFPKTRLGSLIGKPGGKRVADAIEEAKANLSELKGECLADVELAVAEIETRVKGVRDFDARLVDDLYGVATRVLGLPGSVGMEALDVALSSFCVLMDNLRLSKQWDIAAVAVHVQSLRLLLTAAAADRTDGVMQILEGLKQVSARYAPPPDA